MVVVAAARVVALEPLAGLLVEVFADVRLAVHLMGFRIRLHRVEIMAFRDVRLFIVSQKIGQGIEGLRRCEGPDRAVPFAMADAVTAELWVSPFGGGDAERCPEAFR